MTAVVWPPESHYPVAEWTDEELVDQYRYVKAEFAGEDSEYLDTDENVADLIQEIIRRGLDGIAEAVEDSARVGQDPG